MHCKIWMALKGSKDGRSWQSLVGYSAAMLKSHLAMLFTDGMGWDNYGVYVRGGPLRWSIDHIQPQSSFTFQSASDPQFKECWALKNLQPLWVPDNSAKLNRPNYQPKTRRVVYIPQSAIV